MLHMNYNQAPSLLFSLCCRGRQDLAEWQQKYEKLQSDNSRDIVARDLELETFRDSENKHRDKISKFKDEIER